MANASREKSDGTLARLELAGTGCGREPFCAAQQFMTMPWLQQARPQVGAAGAPQRTNGCAMSICPARSTTLQRMAITDFTGVTITF